MPETPGVCISPGKPYRPVSAGDDSADKPYPFLRNPDATRPARRLAYPFLRLSTQKRVQSRQMLERLKKGESVPVSAPLEERTVPVSARGGAPRPDSNRTLFCEAGLRSAVPVSARRSAETGTPYLQALSPSPWPIRLFTRRNRYGSESHLPARRRQTAISRPGFSDESSGFPPSDERLGEVQPGAACDSPRRNRYAWSVGLRFKACTRFRSGGVTTTAQAMTGIGTLADLGTLVRTKIALTHAETGTLWQLSD